MVYVCCHCCAKQDIVNVERGGSSKIGILVKTQTGKIIQVVVDPHRDNFRCIKQKIQELEKVPAEKQTLMYSGKQLEDDKCCDDYNIKRCSTLYLVVSLHGGHLRCELVIDNKLKEWVLKFEGYNIKFKSFKISPKSDALSKDMFGLVLYMYDGKKFQSGHIVLKKTANIKNVTINNGPKTYHHRLYKSVFGREIETDKVVGGGFGITADGKLNYRSTTFNVSSSKYHNDKRNMSNEEMLCIQKTIVNWKENKIQTTTVTDIVANSTNDEIRGENVNFETTIV